MESTRQSCSGMYPTWSRMDMTSLLGSRPTISISPETGSTRPSTVLMNVLLPAPFGPRRPTTPLGMLTLKLSKASMLSNRTMTSDATIVCSPPGICAAATSLPILSPLNITDVPWSSYCYDYISLLVPLFRISMGFDDLFHRI